MNMNRMKVWLIVGLMICIAGGVAVAGEAEPVDVKDAPVHQLSPQIEAMGGAFTPIARGYEALFTNPAGLSRKGGQLTFANINVGPYLLPTESLVEILARVENEEEGAMKELIAELDFEKGTGTNLNFGAGFAAFGIGLGFLNDIDIIGSYGTEEQVDITGTSSVVAGVSHGFKLGSSKLHMGADARGLVRVRTRDSIPLSEFDSVGFNPELIASIGYGFDAGAILETSGGFTLGGALKNIGGTKLTSVFTDAEEVDRELNKNDDPTSLYELFFSDDRVDNYDGDNYIIPMSLTAGVGYDSPAKEALDIRLVAEYTHTFPFPDEESTAVEEVIFDLEKVRLGAEVGLLRMLKVRGGLNEGNMTAGVGLNLFVIEVDATYYHEIKTSGEPNEAVVIGAKVKL
ncbi:MAG: hypothetical protein ACQEQU_06950 [Spirochaetota bacterium]